MEVVIQHLGNVQFAADARGHRIIADQPADNGGADGGMTPPELMLASLGTCAGHYAAQFLKGRGLSADGLEIRVTAEKLLRPARLDRFHIDVYAPAMPPEHEAGMMRAVHACLIHNTLLAPPTIEIGVHTSVAV
jgi:uncharacterized OsmC-like protein